MNWCLVFMIDRQFVSSFERTVRESRASWADDIVCLHSEDLRDDAEFDQVCRIYRVTKLFRPLIDISQVVDHIRRHPYHEGASTPPNNGVFRKNLKLIQWHKLWVFDTYFKKWDRILYLDAGMYVPGDLNRLKKLDSEHRFIAHSDAYPTYQWKLHSTQFEKNSPPEVFQQLAKTYDLEIDYFQTGVMLFDTTLITEETRPRLIELMNIYPISNTNDQAIVNLVFNCELKVWSPLPIKDDIGFIYDYWNRHAPPDQYLMFKYRKPAAD